MSIRYRSFTETRYKTLLIGNEISCFNLKEKIRKEESLPDKNINIILSFENARADETSITRNATIIFKMETKASGKKELIVNVKGAGGRQIQRDPVEYGAYKRFANVKVRKGDYICHRCGKINDHNIRDCPTNNDPKYGLVHKSNKKIEPIFGVPQIQAPKPQMSMQRQNQDLQQQAQNINSQEEQYKCKICKKIMDKPNKIGCCGEISCEECIKGKLKETGCTCPFCGTTPVYSNNLYPDNILKKEIEDYLKDKNEKSSALQDQSAMQQQMPQMPQMPLMPQMPQMPGSPPQQGQVPQMLPAMLPGMMPGMQPGNNSAMMDYIRFFSMLQGKDPTQFFQQFAAMGGMGNGMPNMTPIINGNINSGENGTVAAVTNNNGGSGWNGHRGGRRGSSERGGRDYGNMGRGCIPDVSKLESLSKPYGRKDSYDQDDSHVGEEERQKEQDRDNNSGRSDRNDEGKGGGGGASKDDEICTPPDSDDERSEDRSDRRRKGERSSHSYRSHHHSHSRSRSNSRSRDRDRDRSSRRHSDEDRERSYHGRDRHRHYDDERYDSDDDHHHRSRHGDRGKDNEPDRKRRRRD